MPEAYANPLLMNGEKKKDILPAILSHTYLVVCGHPNIFDNPMVVKNTISIQLCLISVSLFLSLFRIGWTSILGSLRVLILLLYHLLSLQKL